ncbi:hypothetical protein ACFQ1S_47280, partial [Kibdelosporangium lantanae]
VVLTVGTINAYVSGAAAGDGPPRWLILAILTSGGVLIGLHGAGALPLDALMTVPSAMFLVVYLGCTAAAFRLLTGPTRIAAGVSFLVVALILAFTGALAVCAIVALMAQWIRLKGVNPTSGRKHATSGRKHATSACHRASPG